MKPTETDLKLRDTLNEWTGKLIHISKQQNRDQDEASMTLNEVSFYERPVSIDGYVSPFVLQLHGKGRITAEHAQYEQIPYETYEIPLSRLQIESFRENEISLQTDDGSYTITHY